MAENEEELKSLLMKMIESEKVGLKLNIQKTKIMASGSITSWQINGETMEPVTDFIFLSSKITADDDCSHEIKRCLLLGRKSMTNLDSILKHRHYFSDKGPYQFSLAHFSCSVMSDSLWPHGLQHTRLPCTSPTPGADWVFSNESVGQSIGVSASPSALSKNIQDRFPLGLTGLTSLQSKRLLRLFSSTTVPTHQFFSTQPSL